MSIEITEDQAKNEMTIEHMFEVFSVYLSCQGPDPEVPIMGNSFADALLSLLDEDYQKTVGITELKGRVMFNEMLDEIRINFNSNVDTKRLKITPSMAQPALWNGIRWRHKQSLKFFRMAKRSRFAKKLIKGL